MARAATIGSVLVLLLAGCANPPDRPRPTRLVHLHQGWSNRQRQYYYYTPQGTELHGLRYSWFRYVELPFDERRFAEPELLWRYGFLYDPAQFASDYQPPAYNPGNLPVGFTYHLDPASGEALLDITCAACHTGQLEYRGRSIRVDGGQALHAFASLSPGQFLPTLILSLQYTYTNPFKFDRFARNVLGTRYPLGKAELRKAFGDTLAQFAVEGYRSLSKGLYPTAEGYGRIDALDHIANTVFGDDLNPANYRVANAPVSYPHVWDIWKFDWVQWNGSVAQPMGRNVGEALGVKARLALVDRRGNGLPPDRLYESSVLIRELHCIETTLWQLRPPLWREDVLGPIDRAKAERGRALFEANCRPCHGPHVYLKAEQATPDKPIEWRMTVVPVAEIGTDPSVVDNFLGYVFNASAIAPGNPTLDLIDSGSALNQVTKGVIERKYAELGLSEAARRDFDGFGRELGVRRQHGYKARPLHGIWATPPYLHNGSVPNVYQLLLPEEQRAPQFTVGSREYDPVLLGYRTESFPGGFTFDTGQPGNANTGHQFRDDGGVGVIGRGFSDAERFALIEYLKVLGNPKYDHAEERVPLGREHCPPTVQGPAAQLRWTAR